MPKFSEVIQVRKVTSCKTCETYSYLLPCNLTKEIERFLMPFGKLSYPLSHVKLVQIDNNFIKLNQARIGTNKLKIKFKANGENLKPLFDIQVAAFVEEEQGIIIEMDTEEV